MLPELRPALPVSSCGASVATLLSLLVFFLGIEIRLSVVKMVPLASGAAKMCSCLKVVRKGQR